eukprot:10911226-Alexandrium_andersonii.AAC.1
MLRAARDEAERNLRAYEDAGREFVSAKAGLQATIDGNERRIVELTEKLSAAQTAAAAAEGLEQRNVAVRDELDSLRIQLLEVSRDTATSGSARADVGQVAQLAASLEAAVRERDEARAEISRLKTTHLGLLTSARDDRRAALTELESVRAEKVQLGSKLALARAKASVPPPPAPSPESCR